VTGDSALELGRGRVRLSASIGDPAHFATPAASGGRIFVADGGRVYAFG
jgi:PQQ-like domain